MEEQFDSDEERVRKALDRVDRGRKAHNARLGCGSIILITLIVMIFSGGSKVDELKQNVQELTKQVTILQEKVDSLSRTIERQK